MEKQAEQKRIATNLQRKFDRQAIDQLREEVVRLAEENEQLKFELDNASSCADLWHDHAMQLNEALEDENFVTHRSVGLTKDGELLVVSHEH